MKKNTLHGLSCFFRTLFCNNNETMNNKQAFLMHKNLSSAENHYIHQISSIKSVSFPYIEKELFNKK